VSDLAVQVFRGLDGVELAYRETGTGRALVLIHGLFSSATVNWIRPGTAAALAARGFRVIMPDLRAHGDSGKPHDPGAYPPDVLADDALALIEHLGLDAYDLGGYSLGGRTVVRALLRGAAPGRAVVAGMGLDGIIHGADRNGTFRRVLGNLGTFERGTPEWKSERFLKAMHGDPEALIHILGDTAETTTADLAGIATPTLVVMGADDDAIAGARPLADALPNGRFVEVPGDHMSAVVQRDLGAAIGDFLTEPRG
jgi:pimeloyl-ACP methyl ester carboxylesterase